MLRLHFWKERDSNTGGTTYCSKMLTLNLKNMMTHNMTFNRMVYAGNKYHYSNDGRGIVNSSHNLLQF